MSQEGARRNFSIGDYLGDVLRTGSLSPPNPILVALKDDNRESLTLGVVKPSHLATAAKTILEQYETQLSELDNVDHHDAAALVAYLHKMQRPIETVQRLVTMYAQLNPFSVPWLKACEQAMTTILSKSVLPDSALEALEEHHAAITAAPAETDNQEQDGGVDEQVLLLQHHLELLIRQLREEGIGFGSNNNSNDDSNKEKAEEVSSLGKLLEAKRKVQYRFLTPEEVDPDAPQKPLKEVLQDLYIMCAIHEKEAQLRGYSNAVEHRFATSSPFTVEQVRQVHAAIADKCLTTIRDTPESAKLASEYPDLMPYLSLDGTLVGLFALTRALFGVMIVEETDKKALKNKLWYHEVRVFHIYDCTDNDTEDPDEEKYLGTFYLDPFFRPIKTRQPHTGVILDDPKTVYMSTTVRASMWDHLPTPLPLDKALDLVHEFGHVLQHILVDSRSGNDADKMSVELSEVLPQFMEHWLMEPDILQTLAQFSESPERIPDELLESMRVTRNMRKAYEGAYRVFLGELELDYYSRRGNNKSTDDDDNDNEENEEESIVAMQSRLAVQYVQHNQPAKNDLSPLLELLESNVRGKHICQYRYLVSELISAELMRRFGTIDMDDEAAMRELGLAFRTQLMGPGSRIGLSSYEAFSGRAFSEDAWLELYDMK